jgi:hypothetical protein
VGKRPEDLPLDDTPITTPPEDPAPSPIDARDTGWYQFIVEIEDLLATGQYTWASETLEGIQDTVERSHRVTPGQRNAVAKISASREGRTHGRRYEGFY